MFPPRVTQESGALIMDKWVADDGGRVDDLPVSHFRKTAVPCDSMRLSDQGALQGTAQIIVAGAGIFHPDWVAKSWQTCEPDYFPHSEFV